MRVKSTHACARCTRSDCFATRPPALHLAKADHARNEFVVYTADYGVHSTTKKFRGQRGHAPPAHHQSAGNIDDPSDNTRRRMLLREYQGSRHRHVIQLNSWPLVIEILLENCGRSAVSSHLLLTAAPLLPRTLPLSGFRERTDAAPRLKVTRPGAEPLDTDWHMLD